MDDLNAWVEFFRTLGIAGPLVGFLVFIYNKSDAERRETQSKFLDALQTTIMTNAKDRELNTAALADVRAGLAELTAAIRERGLSATAEHEKHLQMLQRIAERLDHRA